MDSMRETRSPFCSIEIGKRKWRETSLKEGIVRRKESQVHKEKTTFGRDDDDDDLKMLREGLFDDYFTCKLSLFSKRDFLFLQVLQVLQVPFFESLPILFSHSR